MCSDEHQSRQRERKVHAWRSAGAAHDLHLVVLPPEQCVAFLQFVNAGLCRRDLVSLRLELFLDVAAPEALLVVALLRLAVVSLDLRQNFVQLQNGATQILQKARPRVSRKHPR